MGNSLKQTPPPGVRKSLCTLAVDIIIDDYRQFINPKLWFMTELDHSVLREYANTFRTYGDLTNKVWFLGLDEGGGGSLEQVTAKLSAWKNSGSKVEAYLSGPGASRCFKQSVGKSLQPIH